MHPAYEKYLNDMKRLGAQPPYMSEQQVMEALGIVVEEPHEPLIITPRNQKRPMRPTLENHIVEKKPKVKKPKAERKPREKMTDEERLKRKRERMQKKREELKAHGLTTRGGDRKIPVGRLKLSDEQKKAYKREYMKKWRKAHPKASYETNMKWRNASPENMEKHREWNRKYAAKKRAESKLSA